MRVRLATGAGVVALFFFGFLAGADADPVRADSARLGLFTDLISAQASGNHAEAIRADQGWVRAGEDLDRLYRQMIASRNRQTAKPFRGEGGEDRDRQPVSAPVASLPAAPPSPSVPASSLVPTLPPAAQPLPGTGLMEVTSPLPPAGLLALGPQAMSPGPADLALAPIGAAAQAIPTPEPASLVLLGSGLVGFTLVRLRRRKTRTLTPEL